ncbi:CsbD family protein [Pelagibius sp. CAU 1746]|uniref:CsbD family protein n=1 Tax=Pelagibius sp. CAU 1746 TaxID=3140370 RepID=UPI00325B702B
MDKDRITGSAKKIMGSVRKTIGRANGDAKLASAGEVEEIEGKVQSTYGSFKDTRKN